MGFGIHLQDTRADIESHFGRYQIVSLAIRINSLVACER